MLERSGCLFVSLLACRACLACVRTCAYVNARIYVRSCTYNIYICAQMAVLVCLGCITGNCKPPHAFFHCCSTQLLMLLLFLTYDVLGLLSQNLPSLLQLFKCQFLFFFWLSNKYIDTMNKKYIVYDEAKAAI